MEVLILLLVLSIPFALVGLLLTAVLKPESRERLVSTLGAAGRSLPGRLALMAATGLLLLIPLELVDEVRRDRGYRLDQVQSELATQWGGHQTVIGPMLWVPVIDHSEERVEKTDKDGNVKVHFRPVATQREYLVLPDRVAIAGEVAPQALHRGLYDVLVYNASIELDATFARPEWQARPGHELEVLWPEAQLLIGLSDLSSVAAVNALTWQGAPLHAESGPLPRQTAYRGIRGVLPGFEGEEAAVRIALDLRGMDTLLVGAVGETTEVALAGSWDAPSFTGFTLPRDRTVEGDRFEGSWSVPGVARPIPQQVELVDSSPFDALQGHTVGVRLAEPASPYLSVERALTYGILVIALCLLTFLVVEHGLGLQLHPVQWGVNGLALVVFYLILLAASEHQGFQIAYGTASAVTVGLITLYTLVSTRALRAAATVFGALAVLYAAMFGMLRSEDHALITGTALVVIALAAAMWVTRNLAPRPVAHAPFADSVPV